MPSIIMEAERKAEQRGGTVGRTERKAGAVTGAKGSRR